MELSVRGIIGSFNPQPVGSTAAVENFFKMWIRWCHSLAQNLIVASIHSQYKIQSPHHDTKGPALPRPLPTFMSSSPTISWPSLCSEHPGIFVSLIHKTGPASEPLHLLFYPPGVISASIAIDLTLNLFTCLFKEASLTPHPLFSIPSSCVSL